MSPIIPPLITTFGLVFDITGALLVANEVIRVFKGATSVDIGDAECYNGSTKIVQNPKFEEHEKRKRLIMSIGLTFLVVGFILQGVTSALREFPWKPLDVVFASCGHFP